MDGNESTDTDSVHQLCIIFGISTEGSRVTVVLVLAELFLRSNPDRPVIDGWHQTERERERG